MELDSVKVGGTIKCVSKWIPGDEYTAEVKEIFFGLRSDIEKLHLADILPS